MNGKPRVYEGKPDGQKRRIALVAGRFNDIIGKRLVAGALEILAAKGVQEKDIELAWVPGAWEIPPVAEKLVKTGRFHGLIALGAVIQGETTHHEHIGREVSSRLSRLAGESGIPVAFGVLTTTTLEQALERSGERESNKGAEAALHLLELLNVLDQIR